MLIVDFHRVKLPQQKVVVRETTATNSRRFGARGVIMEANDWRSREQLYNKTVFASYERAGEWCEEDYLQLLDVDRYRCRSCCNREQKDDILLGTKGQTLK